VLYLLPAALILFNFAVPPLTRELIGLPHSIRIVLAVLFIAPVAFLMGIPFPTGMRAIAGTNPQNVGWAWAANGCASVTGSVAAVMGAMAFNFSTVILAAAMIYGIALWGASRTRRLIA
jgi:hypothetical protein